MTDRIAGALVIGAVCVAVSVSVAAGGVAAFFFIMGDRIVQNPSPSLQRGLYIRDEEPIGIGSIVKFPLPDVMREYMSTVDGALAIYDKPGNGLLKEVAAVGGATICRHGLDFSINGVVVATALRVGPSGWWLPVWEGCRVLAADEVAVLSTRIADSDDSRYYGAVPLSSATAYRPFFVEK